MKNNNFETLYNVNGARTESNKNNVNKNYGYKSEFSDVCMYVCMNLDRCNLDDIPTNTLLFDSF